MFVLANKIGITEAEKEHITGILSGTDQPVFMTQPINTLFSFTPNAKISVASTLNKNKLIIPVNCLSEGCSIKTTVSSGGQSILYDDWSISKVDRKSKDFNTFEATFTSENAKSCKWNPDSTIKVEISNGEYSNSTPLILNFKVCSYKDNGIFPDTFDFEQVI